MFLQSSFATPLSDPTYLKYTISMFSNAGETIVGFSEPSLTPWPNPSGQGAHQVFPPIIGTSTPTRQSQLDAAPLWSDSWLDYDTYFFVTDANSIHVGSISETKTGTGASLPSAGFGAPGTGFGSMTSTTDTAYAFLFGSGLRGQNVPLMQIVMKQGSFVQLSLNIQNEQGMSVSRSIIVPTPAEPAAVIPAMVAIVALGLIRLRRN
jgi:hypothetical protein